MGRTTWILGAIAACVLLLASGMVRSQSTHFSDTFKAAVDKAMAQPTGKDRTKLLIQAMQGATDDEVFAIFPLLFTAKILNGAMSAHVCLPEINASLAYERTYLKSSPADQKRFPTTHAKQIRVDTDNLITCLDQYYANGELRLPKPSSN